MMREGERGEPGARSSDGLPGRRPGKEGCGEGRVSLLDDLPPEERKKVRRAGKATWAPPMLATLTHQHFSSPDWIYERKLDGERCLAVRPGRSAELYSRNQLRIDGAYPEIVEAVESQTVDDFTIDGEVVAFEGNQTSFARLQRRMQTRDPEQARRSGVAVYYYVFDVLHVDGHDITGLPLRWRKRLLRRLLDYADPLRFTTHRNTEGERFHDEACHRGWEGLIAKPSESPFADKVPGRDIHFVKPQLVCEIGFTEWTVDGRLRHPRFLGLRRDKRPREVVRERPRAGDQAARDVARRSARKARTRSSS